MTDFEKEILEIVRRQDDQEKAIRFLLNAVLGLLQTPTPSASQVPVYLPGHDEAPLKVQLRS